MHYNPDKDPLRLGLLVFCHWRSKGNKRSCALRVIVRHRGLPHGCGNGGYVGFRLIAGGKTTSNLVAWFATIKAQVVLLSVASLSRAKLS